MRLVPLSAAADIAMGSAPPSASYNETGQGVPMIAGAGDFGDVYPKPKKWTTETTRLAAKGDLLVCVRATIGDLNWADRDYCLGRGVAGIRAKAEQADIRYIARILEAKKSDLSQLGTGSTFLAIRKSDLEDFEIPLPAIADQRRIAAVLDKANALRLQRQESLQLTEDLLQSAFLSMFGDPVTNPKAWPLAPLTNLGTLDRGVSKHRPRNAPELLGGRYPLIQTGEVSNAGHYIREFTHTYSELGLKQSKMWPKGTLCITIAANIAQTAMLSFAACFPDSVVGFTPHEGVSTSVYVHFLFGFLQAILEKNAPQAAQKNINLAILRTLQVPKPPFMLQRDFDVIAAKTMDVLDDQSSSLGVMKTAFHSIQQRAFHGGLDLSRLVLDPEGHAPAVHEPQKPVSIATKSGSALFLKAPETVEAELKKLDEPVSNREPIPWSADYFKYRILGLQPTPFSFSDVMQRAESVFNEAPPYEQIKDMILELLRQDGGPARLSQRFDFHIDAKTKEASGRKEIVFEPAP
jgi:type I restriction enzyme S subunit